MEEKQKDGTEIELKDVVEVDFEKTKSQLNKDVDEVIDLQEQESDPISDSDSVTKDEDSESEDLRSRKAKGQCGNFCSCIQTGCNIINCVCVPLWCFYTWMLPIFIKGRLRPLQFEDIPELGSTFHPRYYHKRFLCMLKFLKGLKVIPRCIRIIFAVYSCFVVEVIISGLIQLLAVCMSVSYPFFLSNLILSLRPRITDSERTEYEFFNLILPSEIAPGVNYEAIGFRTNDYEVWIWLGAMLIALLFNPIFQTYHLHLMMKVGVKMRTLLVSMIYMKAINLSTKERNYYHGGRIMNFVVNDCMMIEYFNYVLHQCWSSIFVCGFCIYYLISILGLGTLVSMSILLITLPTICCITGLVSRARMVYFTTMDSRMNEMNDVFTGIKLLKFFTWENPYLKKIFRTRKKEVRLIRRVYFLMVIWSGLSSCTPSMMMFVGFIAYHFIYGMLDPVIIFSSIAIFDLMRAPAVFLPNIITNGTSNIIMLNRIGKYLEAEEVRKMKKVDDDEFAIVIENADFRWDKKPAPKKKNNQKKKKKTLKEKICCMFPCMSIPRILSKKKTKRKKDDDKKKEEEEKEIGYLLGVNLRIRKGSLTCIVGKVGSGKSSLLSAIIGEMRMTNDGEVRICGDIAFCNQQPWVSNKTLQDNILFGKERKKKFLKIIHDCALEQDIKELKGGVHVEIGEKGINLSGGQKYRVALARACYSDRDIYMLDDPLAAVDSPTGEHIYRNVIRKRLRRKTVLLVTHKLVLCRKADLVVFVDNGRISEIGSFEELERKRGSFYEFFTESERKVKEEDRIHIEDDEDEDEGEEEDEDSEEDVLLSPSKIKIQKKKKSLSLTKKTLSLGKSLSIPKRIVRGLGFSDSPGHTPSSSLKRVKERRKEEEPEDEEVVKKELAALEKLKGENVLTEKEERAKGVVKFEVFNTYVKFNGGYCVCCFILAIYAIGQIIFIFSQWYLTNFTSQAYFHKEIAYYYPVNYYIDLDTSETYTFDAGNYDLVDENGTNICPFTGNVECYAQNVKITWEPEDRNYDGLEEEYEGTGITPIPSLAIYSGLTLCFIFFVFCQQAVILNILLSGSNRMFKAVIRRVMFATQRWFDSRPIGRILSRLSNDIMTTDIDLIFQIDGCLQLTFFAIGSFLLVMYTTLGILVPLILICLVLFILFFLFFQPTTRELKRIHSIRRSPIMAHFNQTLSGISTIRAYEKEDDFMKEQEVFLDGYNRVQFYFQSSNRWIQVHTTILGSIVIFFTTVVCVILAHYANISYWNYAFYALGITNGILISSLMENIFRTLSFLETNSNSVERLNHYIKRVPVEEEEALKEAKLHEKKMIPKIDPWIKYGRIVFKNYYARYAEDKPMILKKLSFEILPGERIGVVGRTASGKSTLLLCLMRILEASKGKIMIDGEDIKKRRLRELRSNISIIPQEPTLFIGTVRTNLDPFHIYSDEEVVTALKKSQLEKRILKKEGGINQEVKKGGENFSVGERQLICLARAILENSKILLLDECTASVDLINDRLIQDTIRTEFTEQTVISIAHRLLTICDYNKILVLDKGMVSQFDTPYSLIQDREGVFYGMVQNSPDMDQIIRIINRNERVRRRRKEGRGEEDDEDDADEEEGEEEEIGDDDEEEETEKDGEFEVIDLNNPSDDVHLGESNEPNDVERRMMELADQEDSEVVE